MAQISGSSNGFSHYAIVSHNSQHGSMLDENQSPIWQPLVYSRPARYSAPRLERVGAFDHNRNN
jgi:hypothetical protein